MVHHRRGCRIGYVDVSDAIGYGSCQASRGVNGLSSRVDTFPYSGAEIAAIGDARRNPVTLRRWSERIEAATEDDLHFYSIHRQSAGRHADKRSLGDHSSQQHQWDREL